MLPADEAGLHCGADIINGNGAKAPDVLPADEAGLHCGKVTQGAGETRIAVLPADEAGLHCGESTFERVGTAWVVLPADEAGLHCGADLVVDGDPGPESAPGRRGRAPLRQFRT